VNILGTILTEALGISAVILIAYGIKLIYAPAAIIFLGLVLGAPYLILTFSGIKGKNKK